MATWRRYEPSFAVRVVVWPLSFALAFVYIFAIRGLYRAAMAIFPDSLVWASTIVVAATFVRWMLLALMDTKRGEYVEDEALVHEEAA